MFFRRKKPITPANSTEAPKKKKKKHWLREWFDALIFAGIAALIIRTFLLEAFMIPTSSMERSLMVGDFLFVSKFHYGVRLPMIPVCFPFVHNRLPFSKTKSFVDWIQLPYWRLPGLTSIQRNDVVVFNYPADDIMPNDRELGPVKPPSMKENYIKRCVAIAGDTFEIRNQQVYINGQPSQNPPEMQYRYNVITDRTGFNEKILLREYGFRKPGDHNFNWERINDSLFRFSMTEAIRKEFQQYPNIKKIFRDTVPATEVAFEVYPNDTHCCKWNIDNFGPIIIPKRGMRMAITAKNYPIYKRCIDSYEKHKSSFDGKHLILDGSPVSEYTFEMDYYFMMGDNRNNSLDSRFWGFVPEDHVVGKPLFVFFSVENLFGEPGIRWSRFFKGIY
jgi:signal peptidase I